MIQINAPLLSCRVTNLFLYTMQPVSDLPLAYWPLWRKILFRFFCIYFTLYMSPWTWLGSLPVFGVIAEYYGTAENWLVNLGNQHLFHVKDVLVPLNGSGDTSYGYAQLCLFLTIAAVGTLLWTVFDKRRNYAVGYYWLLVAVRYFVALNALTYGIYKVFGQQMMFPSLSALATPLGNLSPMRLAWYFVGYSTPYQFFSGAAEVVAGVLLLFRRTSTLGAVVATSVFLNVMMMNLSYDIDVKLFSTHLFLMSNFLLLGDAQRLLNFFIFNKPTQPAVPITLPTRWMRSTRIALKAAFILLFGLMPAYQIYASLDSPEVQAAMKKENLTTGVFAVERFETPIADSLRWRDIIFEKSRTGSIQTADTTLRQRYNRRYFTYSFDSTKHTIAFKKFNSDSIPLFTLNYAMPDTNHLILNGRIHGDSAVIAFKRQKQPFQLAERPFHWLTEIVP